MSRTQADVGEVVAFVTARLAERKATAQAAHYTGQRWLSEEEDVLRWPDDELVRIADRKRDAAHIAASSPAQVLREVAALSRVVETAQGLGIVDGIAFDSELIEALAAIWPEHPDYRQEWQ